LDYRQKNGLFTALEDLLKVDGISQSLFEKLVG
jgi:DNA uptake protein ComE-like DNA-binding protein